MLNPGLDTLRLPATLGRYRLVERIGRGGFGLVYRGEVVGPAGYTDLVALKVAEPELAAAEPERLHAMADEASVLRRVRHPNIVALRGFESLTHPTFGTLAALVLEFVEGTTLGKLWGVAKVQGRPLELPGLLDIADQLLDALDHAHGVKDASGRPMSLVHRDLKPDNLMVDLHGRLRLLDFGIAWSAEKRVQTAVGLTKGTPPWMSPEQITGQSVDRRSDLFVVGMLLFELLSSAQYVERARIPRALVPLLRSIVSTDFDSRRSAFMAGLARDHGVHGKAAEGLADLLQGLLKPSAADRTATAGLARLKLRGLAGHLRWRPGQGGPVLAKRVAHVQELDRPDIDMTAGTTDNVPTIE
jgi:serine/threonine protein kinase